GGERPPVEIGVAGKYLPPPRQVADDLQLHAIDPLVSVENSDRRIIGVVGLSVVYLSPKERRGEHQSAIQPPGLRAQLEAPGLYRPKVRGFCGERQGLRRRVEGRAVREVVSLAGCRLDDQRGARAAY